LIGVCELKSENLSEIGGFVQKGVVGYLVLDWIKEWNKTIAMEWKEPAISFNKDSWANKSL